MLGYGCRQKKHSVEDTGERGLQIFQFKTLREGDGGRELARPICLVNLVLQSLVCGLIVEQIVKDGSQGNPSGITASQSVGQCQKVSGSLGSKHTDCSSNDSSSLVGSFAGPSTFVPAESRPGSLLVRLNGAASRTL